MQEASSGQWDGPQPYQSRDKPGFPGRAPGRALGDLAAERVILPAKERKRRRRVLVVATVSPGAMRPIQRDKLCVMTWTARQAALAAKRPGGR